MQKGWLDAFNEVRSDVFSQAGMRKWLTDFGEAYEMMTQSDSYKKKLRRKHMEKGAFRSGEGAPD